MRQNRKLLNILHISITGMALRVELEFDQVEQKFSAKAEPQIYYPVNEAP